MISVSGYFHSSELLSHLRKKMWAKQVFVSLIFI